MPFDFTLMGFIMFQSSIWCGQKVSFRPHEGCETKCIRWYLQMVGKNCNNR